MSIKVTRSKVNANYDRSNGSAGLLAPTARGWTFTGLAVAANRAYYVRFVPSKNFTVTSISFVVSIAAGADDACDVGIYSAAGTRLVSAGATSGKLNSTTGTKNVDITNTALSAGVTYYAALSTGAQGGSAATVQAAGSTSGLNQNVFGSTIGLVEGAYQDGAHPLPSSASIAGSTGTPAALWLIEA